MKCIRLILIALLVSMATPLCAFAQNSEQSSNKEATKKILKNSSHVLLSIGPMLLMIFRTLSHVHDPQAFIKKHFDAKTLPSFKEAVRNGFEEDVIPHSLPEDDNKSNSRKELQPWLALAQVIPDIKKIYEKEGRDACINYAMEHAFDDLMERGITSENNCIEKYQPQLYKMLEQIGIDPKHVTLMTYSGTNTAYSMPNGIGRSGITWSSLQNGGFALGHGDQRYIILHNTTSALTPNQLTYLLGHEIMHHKHNDWKWLTAGALACPAISFALVHLYNKYMGQPLMKKLEKKYADKKEHWSESVRAIHNFLFDGWSSWITKAVIGYCLFKQLCIWREYEADRDAIETFGEPAALGLLEFGKVHTHSDSWHPAPGKMVKFAQEYLERNR